ncbi:MAG: type II toxin-antitoxin system PemK/MazF family toxin [Deltaproteobacteria bacterium]|nr:type II toxin-antitoxin system PemK/MazF family toxin [Deltaproteobacteria bacterium]
MTPGDIILVSFPFTALNAVKKRPALILLTTTLKNKTDLITIAMITSKLDGISLPGDLSLQDWQSAKLLHPSLVRLAKVATIETCLVEKRLGKLSPKDFKAVGQLWRQLFEPCWL